MLLTGLAAGNAMGENLPVFVIEKSAKPRCFSGAKSLPCRYRAQNNSWMVGDLCTKWVKEVDMKYASQDRKSALIIDNFPAHPNADGLKALELISLLSHTTKGSLWIKALLEVQKHITVTHSLSAILEAFMEEYRLQTSIC